MAARPVPVYLAHFVQAASTPRMSWAFPFKINIALLTIVTASLVPAAMWSGAITPLPQEKLVISTVAIPSFEVNNVSQLWEGDMSTATDQGTLGQWMNDKGLFTFDVAGVKGLIESSASDSSTFINGTNIHGKLDKTGYSYMGRSYGVGGVAGLFTFDGLRNAESYQYFESGIKSSVNCFLNDTSTFLVEEMEAFNGAVLYAAAGALSTGEEWGGWSYMGYSTYDIFGWGPAYIEDSQSIEIQFSTPAELNGTDPWGFAPFNKLQCNIQFEPDLFSVNVNTTSKRIRTLPLNTTDTTWPAYTSGVLDQLKTWIWALSYVDGCVGGCQLGRALRLNAFQLQKATNDSSLQTLTRATEYFLASVVDNSLVTLLNTRMVSKAPQSTQNTTMQVSIPSFVYGDLKFIGIIIAINAMVVAVYLFEFVRKRFWVGPPPIDISDVGDIILSAYRGAQRGSETKKSYAYDGYDSMQDSKVSASSLVFVTRDSLVLS